MAIDCQDWPGDDLNFLGQSQSFVRENQFIPRWLSTLYTAVLTLIFFFLKFAGKFFRELVISSERGPSYPLEIAEWVSWCTDWLDRKYHYTALWTVVAELTKDSSSLVAWLWRQCFRWLKKFSSSSKLCLFWDYVTCKKNCSAGALFVFTLKGLNILKIQLSKSKVVAPKKRFVMRQPFIWKTRTTRQEKPQERQTIRCMHWVSCSITHKDAWNLLETNQEMLNDVKIL